MEFPINLENARGLLARAVLTQGPDFVYARRGDMECTYDPIENLEDPTDPRCTTGCLIGVALNLAGETRHHGFRGSVGSLFVEFPGMLTPDARNYFHDAQRSQDNGSTWWHAYRVAEETLGASDA